MQDLLIVTYELLVAGFSQKSCGIGVAAQQWQHPSPPRFQSSVTLPRLYTYIQPSFYIVAKDHIFRLSNGASPLLRYLSPLVLSQDLEKSSLLTVRAPEPQRFQRDPATVSAPPKPARFTPQATSLQRHLAATLQPLPAPLSSKPKTRPALRIRVLGLHDLTPPASQLFPARP
ncbi:hypothetical protein MJT46_000223 [Ovis ammon polii x Ovis aries]|nr:hypothetical protein MJT46_000223 [Ovis ammon polii x Ovis aries]